MRSTRGAFLALAVLGGYFIWRNRFAIQRQLEAIGVNTPVLKGNVREVVSSVASKIAGKVERGGEQAEDQLERQAG